MDRIANEKEKTSIKHLKQKLHIYIQFLQQRLPIFLTLIAGEFSIFTCSTAVDHQRDSSVLSLVLFQKLSSFSFPVMRFQLFFNFALTLCPGNQPHYRALPPDGVDPAVPLVLAGGAQLVRLVFALHHPAFVLRLAGLDLLPVGVEQLQAILSRHTSQRES